jgi:HPr kinase/phosphorylase
LSGEAERVHATAVAVGTRAVLIRGPSGSGKSDLALRCLGLPRSSLVPEAVNLVADDQVLLTRQGLALVASAPPTLRGKLEVRGVGILRQDGPIERYPDPWPNARILGFDIPMLHLAPFESSSALKLVTAILMAPQPRAPSKA